jgi:death-on-curing protein
MYGMEQIELADFLLIAESVLDIPGETLKHATRVSGAESALAAPFGTYGGEDFYPEPADKAAILCSRLVRNHPLPDGNKRVAFLCLLELVERNGMIWVAPGQDDLAQTVEWLADRSMSEGDFIIWVRSHVHCP